MTSDATDPLFRPFRLGSLELANRIVMAPMTRTLAPDGVPGAANASYYRRRAEGGVGLILSEGTVVDRPAARHHPGIPLFHGETALAGWKGVIDAVHNAGGKMGPQIWHTGAVKTHLTDWVPNAPPESPSGYNAPDDAHGEAMSDAAVADTIAAFAKAAADAKRLGFDTVELHGAHGYLIDQFFWSGSNLRADRYGGPTIRERARFAVEAIAAVRAAVGPDFPVILRVSQWKQQDYAARIAETPDEMSDWLQPLVDAGADVLHCSQRRFWEPEFPDIDGEKGLNFAGWAKKLTGAVTISVGSVGLSGEFMTAFRGKGATVAGIDGLLERMARDEFDLIAIGRALLTDPLWVAKIRAGDVAGLKGFDVEALAELF
ncbi:12-oxophytodienoate reductase [Sphingopyxis lindanitolerans]|uniref:12-oxophytodienoate reductase n=1 Tax=Sphingopyxis lindanitolerans TaxID=2054227 RepID=A0A2S8B1V0_9SPHN|nr:NADH:flavin oxidoreductase [Sphingopyxis lindanitolerans]PQM26306.1 12-oxophytodienoate reductase [Sphingopyxis lindanitolerans]